MRSGLLRLQIELDRIEPETGAAHHIHFRLNYGLMPFLDLNEALEHLLSVRIESSNHFFVEVAGFYFDIQGFFEELKLRVVLAAHFAPDFLVQLFYACVDCRFCRYCRSQLHQRNFARFLPLVETLSQVFDMSHFLVTQRLENPLARIADCGPHCVLICLVDTPFVFERGPNRFAQIHSRLLSGTILPHIRLAATVRFIVFARARKIGQHSIMFPVTDQGRYRRRNSCRRRTTPATGLKNCEISRILVKRFVTPTQLCRTSVMGGFAMNPGRFIFAFILVAFISLSGCNQSQNPEAPDGRPMGTVECAMLRSSAAEHPVLTVTNEYIDPIVSSSPNPNVVRLDVPSGLELEFCWSADASGDGGRVEAYRYGWDILDISDPFQWAIEFTPLKRRGACAPPRAFLSGSHTFHVEVIDEAGSKSQVAIVINILPFPFYLDITPGGCPNAFNPKRMGLMTAAVPGTAAFDLHAIDMSSLELWINGNTVLPVRAFFEDVTSPTILEGECDCHEGGRDRVDDLVLKFSAQEVAQALGAARPGEVRALILLGAAAGAPALEMRGCVTVVGSPEPEEKDRSGSPEMTR